ncbi:TPA: type VI secretion system lipoprotein TssJ [Providencia alcalifaciens]
MHKLTVFFAISFLLTGCAVDPSAITSPEQAISQLNAPFEEGAIRLTIQSSPDLNAFEGIANSCTLLVIQAQKKSTLNELIANTIKLKSLFSSAGAEEDILKVDRYSAMPGQTTTLHIDRSENTRYIAIVAGYYPFPKQQHMMVIAIPIGVESQGWLTSFWQAHLSPLNVSLYLGSDSVSRLDVPISEHAFPFLDKMMTIQKRGSNVP